MTYTRNLFAVMLSLTLMQVGAGALAVAVPLALSGSGASAIAVGMVAAFYAFGFVAGAQFAPRFIRSMGHIRCFAAAAALAAVLALALRLDDASLSWSVMRFAMGACVATLLTAGESWIADAAPREARGGLLGVYHVIAKLGLILGPFLIAGVASGSSEALMIAAAMFALCLIPIAATRKAQPAPPSTEPFGPRRLAQAAPAAVIAALMAGLINGAVTQLAPIYAGRLNDAAPLAAAAAFNAAIMFGGVLSQWPAGWLSDKLDRRYVVAGLAGVSALAAIALALTPANAPEWLVIFFGFVWGVGAMSYYGVAVAHAADRAAPGVTAQMMSGLLLVWAIGSVIGPIIGGAVMVTPIGAPALFWYAALGGFTLLGAMFLRTRIHEATAEGEKDPYASVLATSTAAAALDPRVLDDEADAIPTAPHAPVAPDIESPSTEEPVADSAPVVEPEPEPEPALEPEVQSAPEPETEPPAADVEPDPEPEPPAVDDASEGAEADATESNDDTPSELSDGDENDGGGGDKTP